MSVNLPELTQLVAHMNHKTIYVNLFQKLHNLTNHRGLKLDGAIGQGEICNSLKSENFSKSSSDG